MTPKPFVAFASLALLSALAFGQFVRNPKTEQPICDQLGAVALGAVETFQQATSAMDKREFQQAIPLFQSVLQQAPLFTPAMRRLGASLAESGQLDEGLTYSRRALKIVLSTAVGELGLQKQVGACDNSRTIGAADWPYR
jgi:tetratricopeptide (TPR) repeat protein